MCFSAGASFGASAVLGTLGVISLRKVEEPEQRPFAMIPLVFAVQQLSEGMLWIGLSDPGHAAWRHFPVYVFLIFAQLIWPVWVPFSVSLMEKNPVRKRILMGLTTMGLSISLYLLYCMFAYDVSAEIRSGHIHYTLNFPLAFSGISSVLYFIPTVVSLFVSSARRMPYLAGAILISFIITEIFFKDYLISVWCFFAAILSLMVIGLMTSFQKERGQPAPVS